MDDLLCSEEELMMCLMMSPCNTITPDQSSLCVHKSDRCTNTNYAVTGSNYPCTTKQDCEESFKMYMEKEITHLPEPGYVKFLHSNNFINAARCNTIHWLIQSRGRLNLSFETVSNAANYLDRFISLRQCKGWKYWMVDLLSVACLSTASKSVETSPPSLHEIQMEGLKHTFTPRLIQEMELKLLQALDWRLNSTTPYSYLELIAWDIDLFVKPRLIEDVFPRLSEMLLFALLDSKLLEFRPSVIAICLLQSILGKFIPAKCDAHLTHFITLIPKHIMDDLNECHEMMMREQLFEQLYNNDVLASEEPQSPVTVLTMECVKGCDRQLDCSLFNMPSLSTLCNKKRKRIQY